MKESRARLDAMYEPAVTIRTASSNITNNDDHEAACCKAIAFCMDNEATQSEVLRLMDIKAPMTVWEKDGR